MKAFAPGKLVLTGAYAVLEGAPAIAVAVTRGAVADAARVVGSPTPEVRAALGEQAPLVDASAMFAGTRKLGLGASAAILVASLAAVEAAAGADLATEVARGRIFARAREAHARAQAGGSGVDVAASVHGGAIRYVVGEPVAAVALPTGLGVHAFACATSARTSELRASVDALAAANADAHRSCMDELADIARAGAGAVARGDASAFVEALRRTARALARLGVAAGVPIVPVGFDALEGLAGEGGASFSVSGAGGGDVAVYVGPRAPDARFVERARALGVLPLDLTLDALGVRLAEPAAVARSSRSAGSSQRRPVRAVGSEEPMTTTRTSQLSGFYKVTVEERRNLISEATGVTAASMAASLDGGGLSAETADKFVENVLGTYGLPYGVTLNVRVNGQDHVAPMVVEEPSVVAAASNAAKMVRAGGGFEVEVDPPVMISQIQIIHVKDRAAAARAILAATEELLALADAAVPGLVARGGGARGLEVRALGEASDEMIVAHVLVDCRDAMGANLINTVAEAVADRIASLAAGVVGLRILSNLCDRRCVRVRCRVPAHVLATEQMDGQAVIDGIVNASRFAELDPYRAATHNKGIMNGVDAVVIATGNDWRAVEAGAHAFAARSGTYRPLSIWRREGDALSGVLELPLALGTVGGTLRVHPSARLSLEIMGVTDAADLAGVAAAVGLASNLAAVRALATDGIQRGHMALHARSVALAAGALGAEVERVAGIIVEARDITVEAARRALGVERKRAGAAGHGDGSRVDRDRAAIAE